MATPADFQQAVAFVLAQEGGYVNDPADPGGETKYGITKRSYPYLDIATLTREQAIGLYYVDYWEASGAPGLPMPLALVVFDTAVNVGVSRAQDWLAQSGGNIDRYLALRETYYRDLAASQPSRFAKFLAGWLARIANLRSRVATVAVVGGIGVGTLLAGLALVWVWRRRRARRS